MRIGGQDASNPVQLHVHIAFGSGWNRSFIDSPLAKGKLFRDLNSQEVRTSDSGEEPKDIVARMSDAECEVLECWQAGCQ